MFDEPAQGWRPTELGRSPMLDGMERRDSLGVEFLKFLGSALTGVVGGGVAAIVIAVVIALVIALAVGLSGASPDALLNVLSQMQEQEPPSTLGALLAFLAFLAVLNTLAMVGVVLIASLLRRRKFTANITSARRFRWGQLFAGLVLNAVALGGLLGVETLVGGLEPEWPLLDLTNSAGQIALMIAAVTAAFLLAAFAEEILFRGWLLRESSVFSRNVVFLLLVNGLLFSAIHFNPQNPQLDPNAFVARTVMGMAFCYMALRLGGIEFATGAHAANNILLTLVVEPISLMEPPPEPIQAGLMLESVVLMAIGVVITEFAARAPFMRRVMGPQATAPSERYDTFS